MSELWAGCPNLYTTALYLILDTYFLISSLLCLYLPVLARSYTRYSAYAESQIGLDVLVCLSECLSRLAIFICISGPIT